MLKEKLKIVSEEKDECESNFIRVVSINQNLHESLVKMINGLKALN